MESVQLAPSADGILRLASATSSSPGPAEREKDGPRGIIGMRSLNALLDEEMWMRRLDVKPRAPKRPPVPAEEWFIPEFDIDLRYVTVADFVKLCGCGLSTEANSVLEEHPNWDLNAINDVGDTALHAACYHGHIDTVIFLLDHESVVVDFENDGWRPIHIAADRGDLEILQLLISRGADPNAPGQGGLTPLHLACLKGHAAVVDELVVKHNVDVNARTVGNRTVHDGYETALHLAALVGAFDCADILLRHIRTLLCARTAMGWTALHIACEHGHTETVELFLWYARWNAALGIEVNAVNCGWTPLHLACDEGHVEIVCLLLFCGGADVNYKAFGCFAPLHLAVAQGHKDVVVALLSRRTLDKDIRTDGGSTALHIACEHNHQEVVQTLLQAGADAHLATVTGDTALHTVADKGFVKLWHFLLGAGVNANTPNHAGITPLDLATSKGHNMNKKKDKLVFNTLAQCVEHGDKDAVSRFLAANKDAAFLNATDKDGRTALHVAAENGHYQILCKLISTPGVKLNAQTYTGNTALHLAAALGHRMMTKKLLGHREIQVNILNHGWTPVSLHNMMPDSHVYAAFEHKSGLQGVYVHDGREALHAASGAGHVLVTKMILHHPNVDVNARSRGYLTALHLAAERGDVDMVEMLMTFRRDMIDINATDGNGATPLHDACRNGHKAVVNRLLSHPGIDVNVMTTRYYGQRCYYKRCGSGTPLHIACEYSQAGVVRLLLRHPEIDPSLPTPWGGTTPLHAAAAVGLVEAVKLLLTFDAVDINALQDDGCTPWDVAFNNGQERVLEILTPVNAHEPAVPDHIVSTSALELQDLTIQRYANGAVSKTVASRYPCVIRFQSSGKGYNPIEVRAMGDFNDWNIYTAEELEPVKDKQLGTTWITVLELPVGENEIQLLIDGARGVDNKRQGYKTTENLHNCYMAVCKPPTMPTLEHCMEGTRIKEVPVHDSKVPAPLAPPAHIPPHEYLQRAALPVPAPSFVVERSISASGPQISRGLSSVGPQTTQDSLSLGRLFSQESEGLVQPERSDASMGVEVKFFKDEFHKGMKVPMVIAMKSKGPAEAAGMMIDDIIVSVAGVPIPNKKTLAEVVSKHEPGDLVPVMVFRDGVDMKVEVKLGSREALKREGSWAGSKLSRQTRSASQSFSGLSMGGLELEVQG